MKTFTKFLTMLAVAALFATGCVNEEPPYKEDPNPEPAGMTGYLSIGNLSMTVVYDETEIRPDDTSDETQAARTASGTRATAPDVDSFADVKRTRAKENPGANSYNELLRF